MEELTVGMRLFWKKLVKLQKAAPKTYAPTANSVAQSKEISGDSCQSKWKKRAAVQKNFAADAKRAAKRQRRERKETRLAKKHYMEVSQKPFRLASAKLLGFTSNS